MCRDAEDILGHHFFQKIDMERMAQKDLDAPYVPCGVENAMVRNSRRNLKRAIRRQNEALTDEIKDFIDE